MIRHRVHVGCGTRNPFIGWLWATLVLALAVSFSLNLTLNTLWGLLAYLPWLAVLVMGIRWDVVHSPRKMYRTWSP
jgi:hypothetical protein